ncbi:MAG: PKD domain-containing protein [Bacteroidota bacterium]
MVIQRLSYWRLYLVLLCLLAIEPLWAQQSQVSASITTTSPVASQLYFTPNVGQWPDENPSIAQAVIPGGAVFITESGLRILTEAPENIERKHQIHHHKGKDTQFTLAYHVTDLKFLNPQKPTEILFQDPAPWRENYFLGHEKSLWKSVSPAQKIILKNLYPGIDIAIYFQQQSLEFDWIIQPGANPKLIGLQVDDQTQLSLLKNTLNLQTSVGNFQINPPKAFQRHALKNKAKPVNCAYAVSSNTIKLNVGKYDPATPLIIDPILVFSTYSGSQGDNFGFTATYDTSGCLYAGGIVDAYSRKYPVTVGAFQTTYGGGGVGAPPVQLPCDISISKYSPDGSKLLFATYMGGDDDEYPHSLCVDPFNNLLIFGTTLSFNFPVHPDSAAFLNHQGDYDIFVNKLSSDGSKLLGGTFIGGTDADGFQTESPFTALVYNYADNYRGDITTDDSGNIYVATCTRSTNFPTTLGALQSKPKGETDAAILCLNNNLSKLKWATLMGGSDDDAAYSVKVDDSAHLYIGGGTLSSNFPMAGAGYRSTTVGSIDGFVARFNKNNGKYDVGTYWGSVDYDQIYFIDLDINNKVYFTGQTEGQITRSPGTYGKNNTSQFIGRFSNDLKSLEFITTFGNRTNGLPELSPSAFMVDNCYNIYFSGWGSNIGVGNAGTTGGLPITSDAHQKITDNNDFYLIVLGKDAKTLKYASYFGGNLSDDHVDGGTSRFDNRGIIYQSVCASCPNSPPGLNDFPTSPTNVAFKNNVSVRCSNASFKLDFRLGYSVDALFVAKPETICLNKTIAFQPLHRFNGTYRWDFGDGDTSHQFNPEHLYRDTGTYTVKLTVTDSNSCNATASYTKKVRITLSPKAAISAEFIPCKPGVNLNLDITYGDSIIWNFGDGTPIQRTSGNGVVKKNYQYAAGQYTATVVIKNVASGCTDTLKLPLQISSDSTHEVKIANVFTPGNADGKNDCFRVYGISSSCENAELRIFNRYGERIFFTKNLDDCWNGRVNNQGPILPAGTYFYQLSIIDSPYIPSPKLYSGVIELIR